jgi:hypothetical protein
MHGERNDRPAKFFEELVMLQEYSFCAATAIVVIVDAQKAWHCQQRFGGFGLPALDAGGIEFNRSKCAQGPIGKSGTVSIQGAEGKEAI